MLYAIGITFLISFILGAGVSHRLTEDAYEAEIAKESRQYDKLKRENDERIFKLANELEAEKLKKKNINTETIKYVTKISERKVYLTECIDDDGLRAINAAISDRPLDPSQPPTTLREGNTLRREDGSGVDEETGGAVLSPK